MRHRRSFPEPWMLFTDMIQDPTDMFEDIPLDTRHHTFKPKLRYPEEWHLNEERREKLRAIRMEYLQLDQDRRRMGKLLDGAEEVQKYLKQAASASPALERVAAGRQRSR